MEFADHHRVIVEVLVRRQVELVVHPFVVGGVKQVLLLREPPAIGKALCSSPELPSQSMQGESRFVGRGQGHGEGSGS